MRDDPGAAARALVRPGVQRELGEGADQHEAERRRGVRAGVVLSGGSVVALYGRGVVVHRGRGVVAGGAAGVGLARVGSAGGVGLASGRRVIVLERRELARAGAETDRDTEHQ